MVAEEKWTDEGLEKLKIPEEIPLLSLKNSVVFPYLATPLIVGRKNSLQAVESASREHKIIVVAAQKEENKEAPHHRSLLPSSSALSIRGSPRWRNSVSSGRVMRICWFPGS